MICGMMTREMNDLEIRVKFVFSPDVILCGWLGSKHQLTDWVTLPLSPGMSASRQYLAGENSASSKSLRNMNPVESFDVLNESGVCFTVHRVC